MPVPSHAGVACFILDDDNNTESGNAFIYAMRKRFRNLSVLVLTPGFEMPESLVLDSIKAADVTVLACYSKISASKGHSGLTDKIRQMIFTILEAARGSKGSSLLISFDSPYLLDQFLEADVRIAAYDRMDEIQCAAAVLIAGE
jgi:hypothetical protein